ncbi:MAG: methyltransferase family protein [Anaerolineales bacterium]
MSKGQRIITPRVILGVFFFIVLVPFLPLLISRQWDWWEAWVYAIISILTFAISRMLAAHRHPDIVAERARFLQHENTQTWDQKLTPLLGLVGILVMVVCGLDELLGWSPIFSLALKMIALVIILAGHVLGTYALMENRYFSGTVRLQADRDQQVVLSGPYQWIRHPGYAGALLADMAIPIFLDSIWAYLPTSLLIALFILRTALEDRFLQDELAGYRDYTKRVRYRLIPGVW